MRQFKSVTYPAFQFASDYLSNYLSIKSKNTEYWKSGFRDGNLARAYSDQNWN